MLYAISDELKKRLKYRYELVEYDIEANIDEKEEMDFLENVCDDFYNGRSDLDTLVRENMDPLFEYSFEEKLEFAKYIEDSIDEFIKSCGVDSFRQALDGGIREYLFAQFFSNADILYSNIIYKRLNEMLEGITDYKEDMLSESDTMFLNFNPSEVEDIIEDFISLEISTSYVYDRSAEDLYSEFCKFISDKIES